MGMKGKYVLKNIKLSKSSSLSIRRDNVAIFHNGKIIHRFTKNGTFSAGAKILLRNSASFVLSLTIYPLLMPYPVANAILDFVSGSSNVENLEQIIIKFRG